MYISQVQRRFIGWFFSFFLMLLLLSSCGGTPQAAPAATIAAAPLPADWQQIDLPRLSVALPPQWTATAAEDLAIDSAVTEMAAQNPQLQALIDQSRAAITAGAVQLLAFDLTPENIGESGFPTNLRIGQQSFPEPPKLSQVAAVNEQDLRQAPGFSDVQRAPVSIGGAEAIRLISKLQINDAAGQPLALVLEQYLLVNGKDVYIITFTTPAADQQRNRTVFDQILATLRLKSAQ